MLTAPAEALVSPPPALGSSWYLLVGRRFTHRPGQTKPPPASSILRVFPPRRGETPPAHLPLTRSAVFPSRPLTRARSSPAAPTETTPAPDRSRVPVIPVPRSVVFPPKSQICRVNPTRNSRTLPSHPRARPTASPVVTVSSPSLHLGDGHAALHAPRLPAISPCLSATVGG